MITGVCLGGAAGLQEKDTLCEFESKTNARMH
jgi:hypothetical protein